MVSIQSGTPPHPRHPPPPCLRTGLVQHRVTSVLHWSLVVPFEDSTVAQESCEVKGNSCLVPEKRKWSEGSNGDLLFFLVFNPTYCVPEERQSNGYQQLWSLVWSTSTHQFCIALMNNIYWPPFMLIFFSHSNILLSFDLEMLGYDLNCGLLSGGAQSIELVT